MPKMALLSQPLNNTILVAGVMLLLSQAPSYYLSILVDPGKTGSALQCEKEKPVGLITVHYSTINYD
jgi:hypothetical protein